MTNRRRYRKKAGRNVVAVQLDLDTDGFVYNKWGATQTCKGGDWLVYNDGDTYTIDKKVFERTYKRQGQGVYVKVTPVWIEIAIEPGSVVTNEGKSFYEAGDYLVYNNEDGTDAYFVSKEIFSEMYEPDD